MYEVKSCKKMEIGRSRREVIKIGKKYPFSMNCVFVYYHLAFFAQSSLLMTYNSSLPCRYLNMINQDLNENGGFILTFNIKSYPIFLPGDFIRGDNFTFQ